MRIVAGAQVAGVYARFYDADWDNPYIDVQFHSSDISPKVRDTLNALIEHGHVIESIHTEGGHELEFEADHIAVKLISDLFYLRGFVDAEDS